MSYSAKLVRGSSFLDLNDGKFSLGADFVPPGVLETAFLAGGTSANRARGADLVGTRAENRSFSFTVRCMGSVSAETHSLASRLASFLAGATDTRQEKTYFEFRPDSDLPEPVWGTFGQALRYEVVHAITALDNLYGRGKINRNAVLVMVNLTIKPYAQGRPIQATVASGGLMEDRIGVKDGSSRGLIVERSTTNYIKNPIFGHGTPLNGWTATTLTATANYRTKLFGTPTIMLSGAAGQFRTTTATIGATGNHVLSCYAKRVDGQPVTNADLKLSFNGALYTTTFQELGDGWYRLYAAINIVSLTTYPCGIDILTNGLAVYVSGFQLEVGTLPSSVCWGDMLGCSWGGSSHNSDSTRIRGNVILNGKALSDSPISFAGTIRISLIFSGALDICFSKPTGSIFQAYLQNNVVVFQNGTVTLSPAIAPALTQGDVVALHFTWTGTALAIYLNGVLLSTTNGVVSNIVDAFNIGNHYSVDYDGYTILDFAVYDQALTAPQVAADYARIKPLKDAKVNISRIPLIHVKDTSTMQLQNALDSTRRNYAVLSGIPGSADALADFYFSGLTSWSDILLSCYDTKNFVNPRLLYVDYNNTADANSSGGGYNEETITTTDFSWPSQTFSPLILEAVSGNNIYLLARLDDLGSGLSLYAVYYLADLKKSSAVKPFVDIADFQYFLTNPIFLPETDDVLDLKNEAGSFYLGLRRSSGSANVKLDFLEVFAGKVLKITTTTPGTAGILLRGNKANAISALSLKNPLQITGDNLTLAPGAYSVLTVSYIPNSTIIKSITIDQIHITPRWHLL